MQPLRSDGYRYPHPPSVCLLLLVVLRPIRTLPPPVVLLRSLYGPSIVLVWSSMVLRYGAPYKQGQAVEPDRVSCLPGRWQWQERHALNQAMAGSPSQCVSMEGRLNGGNEVQEQK